MKACRSHEKIRHWAKMEKSSIQPRCRNKYPQCCCRLALCDSPSTTPLEFTPTFDVT